ncbi:MAG: hypothetical protein ACUVRC_04495 [Desulfotomaculales bacterium]
MRMTPLELLIQGIPEVIAGAALCFALAGVGLRWRHIIPLGVASALVMYVIRLLPLPFGVHTIILCVFLAGYLRLVFRITVLRALCAAFITIGLVILFESVCSIALFEVTGLSYAQVKTNRLVWALFGWPQVVLLFASAFLVEYLRRRYGRK